MKRWMKYMLVAAVLVAVWGLGGFEMIGDVLAQNPSTSNKNVPLDIIAPTDIKGYAGGLQTGGGDLTRLVVLITNYVLGFLGLAAISAIIYAGILYVANFGNDEMTGKAKTIIVYVAIGILVILLSYAFVNALVGVVGEDNAGSGAGSSPGRIGPSDEPVSAVNTLFDPEAKDFISPLITALRDIGDLCPHTPIGLSVNRSGCSQNEFVPDTDADGIANVLDTDVDNDGVSNDQDDDRDGDGVDNGNDICPDTVSFVTFKALDLERNKLQVDRVDEEGYTQFISDNLGCAEYEARHDIDGDGVPDLVDCDADNDDLLDNDGPNCGQLYQAAFPRGADAPDPNLGLPPGLRDPLAVIRDEFDQDDDDDGVVDFGSGLRPDQQELLLRTISNNFAALENTIRLTCATLPQTRDVIQYCGYDPQGNPVGILVSMLDGLSSDLNFTDFEAFSDAYDQFEALVQTFPAVRAIINATDFEANMPTDGTPLRISFDGSESIDPYEEFCPAEDQNYVWFINKTLDFSQGLSGVINSSLNPPEGTGVFFSHDFDEPGIYNVQLLVRSACRFNDVNPGAGEAADVDAAVAGLASARIRIFPPLAQLVVKINDSQDDVGQVFQILTGTETPIPFDLTESITSRGAFTQLDYDCGNGDGQRQILGNQSNWTFDCQYIGQATDERIVRLSGLDGDGPVSRNITLRFRDVIAAFTVRPSLLGTADTVFTFDGTPSQVAGGGINSANFVYTIEKREGTTLTQVEEIQGQQIATHTFNDPEEGPGEYIVTLEVSTGISGQAEQEVEITIEERDPIASFTVTFPETIRPARALFDASRSFHPDFPDGVDLTYIWEVDGVVLEDGGDAPSGPFSYVQETDGDDSRVFFEFQTIGEHQVRLRVRRGDGEDLAVRQVEVTTLLGVDFVIDTPAARVNDVVTFTPESDKAVGYFWDFGDGVTLVGTDEPALHKYDEQGEYLVELTVEDASGNTNSLVKKVRVGLQNQPIAFTQVFVNSIEQDLSQSGCIEVTRKDNVVFDGGQSVNLAGGRTGLQFLWEIEDFDEVFRQRTFTRIFKDLTGGGCVDVDLTVVDLSTDAEDSADTISIDVVNIPPELTDVRFSVTDQDLVTPVSVSVSALGARDLDGRVERYRWWYFEEGQGGQRLDSRVTDVPRTTFVIGPRNIEGTDTTYFFAVEVTDNDGATISTLDDIGPSEPIVVTNGPNTAPVAEFVTDRSTVQTGELIRFNSTTRDPLGEFIPSAAYQWDFEGDGEFERGVSGDKVTFRYPSPGTYNPTLKVTKNGLSSQYEMKIRVLASTEPPEAAFIFVQSGAEVKFISNSTVDPALDDKSIKYAWDFDTTVDTDGNGVPDDDADSALVSTTFEFEGDKDVTVGLKVTDSVGNSDRVVRKIPFVRKDREVGPLGATKTSRLRANLKTNPQRHELDGRVYVRPPRSDVIFNAKNSTGKIQEYRIDTNIFVDSDGDDIPDNDIDNKTHKSWKDGSSFKATYRESDGRIRAKLTVVDLDGRGKSQVVDIVFAEAPPSLDTDELVDPDAILTLLENVPVVSFDVSSDFASPGEELVFDASATSFPDEKVKEYRWDFDGDGLVDEISFEPVFRHVFEEAGAFDVILEAVSVDGLQGEYSQTIFIRGGLILPTADFEFDLQDNEVVFTNLSSFDPSLSEEEVQFEWSFTRLDLTPALDWLDFEQVEEFVLGEREFNLGPLWVTGVMSMQDADLGAGVISREIVLGADEMIARFAEGTTLLQADSSGYVGELSFFPGSLPEAAEAVEEADELALAEPVADETDELAALVDGLAASALDAGGSEASLEEPLLIYDTGTDQVLSASESVRLVFNGVIFDARLHQVQADGSLSFLAEGTVEDNLTTFVLDSFGGRYAVTGTREEGGDGQGLALGVSTVKDPVKVFPEAGLYQVALQITDAVGEKSEKVEVISVDADLQLVEPGEVEGEEIDVPVVDAVPPDVPVTTPSVVDDSDGGGFSYFWLVFVLFIIVIVGVVVFIVVKTIRKRQEEIESGQVSVGQPAAGAEKSAAPEVVKPEIVEPAPAADKAASAPAPKPAPAPKAAAPAPKPAAAPTKPAPAPAKPAPAPQPEAEKPKDDKQDGGDAGGAGSGGAAAGGGGPIPDWLKG